MTTINKYLAVLLLGFVLPIQMANAAVTNVVLPGESIQAKIDISTDGDTVAIFGGTYNEDLVITQAVRLAEVSGQDVTISGRVLISGVSDAPPLEGFVIGSSGKGLVISNTPACLLKNLVILGAGLNIIGESSVNVQDCQLAVVTANGSSIQVVGGSVVGSVTHTTGTLSISKNNVGGSVNQSGGHLYICDSAIVGSVNANSAACTSIIYRCTISSNVNLGAFGIMGYSQARNFFSSTANSTQRLIGCRFNLSSERVHAVQITGANTDLIIANCDMKTIRYYKGPFSYDYVSFVGIDIGSATSRGYVLNNYIQGNYGEDLYGTGNIGIRSSSTQIKMVNNIVETKTYGIEAPFGSTPYGNVIYNCANRYAGGLTTPSEDYNYQPLYDIETRALLPGSPCIDGGTTDLRYCDRDGSRADAGPTGGAWYDPAGWTSDAPVTVSFNLSADQYLEGTLAENVLSGGSAVSLP